MSDNRPRVVRLGSPLENPEREIGIIEEAGGVLTFVEARDEASAIDAIRDADIVINTGGLRFTEAVFDQLNRCRAVIQSSVGYDRIEVPAATARGIMIANLPDYCIEEVADHAVASLSRRPDVSSRCSGSSAKGCGPAAPTPRLSERSTRSSG